MHGRQSRRWPGRARVGRRHDHPDGRAQERVRWRPGPSSITSSRRLARRHGHGSRSRLPPCSIALAIRFPVACARRNLWPVTTARPPVQRRLELTAAGGGARLPGFDRFDQQPVEVDRLPRRGASRRALRVGKGPGASAAVPAPARSRAGGPRSELAAPRSILEPEHTRRASGPRSSWQARAITVRRAPAFRRHTRAHAAATVATIQPSTRSRPAHGSSSPSTSR